MKCKPSRRLLIYSLFAGWILTAMFNPCLPAPVLEPYSPDVPLKWSYAASILHRDWPNPWGWHAFRPTTAQFVVTAVVWGVLGALCIRAAWRGARWLRSRSRASRNRCSSCGYLRHGEGRRCSECGAPYGARAASIPFFRVFAVSLGAIVALNVIALFMARSASWRLDHIDVIVVDSSLAEWPPYASVCDTWSATGVTPGICRGELYWRIHYYEDNTINPWARVRMWGGWPVRWCEYEASARCEIAVTWPEPTDGSFIQLGSRPPKINTPDGRPSDPLKPFEDAIDTSTTRVDAVSLLWCGLSALFLSVIVGANAPATRIERTIQ